MADKLQFDLVSPIRALKSGEVHMVVVPSTEGEFGVLADHAPVMSTIRPGFIQVYETEGATPERIFVRGGFAEVTASGLSILAEEAIPYEQIDRAGLEQQLKDAEEDLADATDDAHRIRAQETIGALRQILDQL